MTQLARVLSSRCEAWSSDHLVALPDLEWLWENWLPRGEAKSTLEGSPEATGKRVRELGLNSDLMKWCFEDSVPRGQRRLEFLLFLVRNGGYDPAVVDTYRGLLTGDERRADHARHVLDLIRGVAQEHRSTILLIHRGRAKRS